MSELSSGERVCWITLLCFAGASENSGKITHVSETHLLRQSGIKENSAEWKDTTGVLKKFLKLGMITHDNGKREREERERKKRSF